MQNNDRLLRTARVEFAEGSPLGLRQITNSLSSLRVTAGPMAALDLILQMAGNPQYIAYVLKGQINYVGHGCGTRRIGDRLEKDDLDRIRQVFIVHSDAAAFGKQAVRTLERLLWELAVQNAVPLANRAKPSGVGKDDLRCAESRELSRDARSLLWCAGCTFFEEADEDAGSLEKASLAAIGLRLLKASDLPAPEGPRLHLNCGGVRAEGFHTADGFVVLPGSQFHRNDRKGLDEHNRRRRDEIRRIAPFDPSEIDSEIASLRVGLLCISEAMGAKMVTGSHLGAKAWNPLQGQC